MARANYFHTNVFFSTCSIAPCRAPGWPSPRLAPCPTPDQPASCFVPRPTPSRPMIHLALLLTLLLVGLLLALVGLLLASLLALLMVSQRLLSPRLTPHPTLGRPAPHPSWHALRITPRHGCPAPRIAPNPAHARPTLHLLPRHSCLAFSLCFGYHFSPRSSAQR